jgi:hypothetical protein
VGGVLLSTGILCKVGEARLTEEEEGSLYLGGLIPREQSTDFVGSSLKRRTPDFVGSGCNPQTPIM